MDSSKCSRLVPERERGLRGAARRARRDLQHILPIRGGVERRRLHCERLHECTSLWVLSLSNCSALRKLVRAPALENTPETGSSRRGGKGITVASLRVGREVPQPCTRVGRTAVGQRPSDANPARWGRRAYCERAGRAREGVGRALKQKKSPREPRGRPGSNRNTVGGVLDLTSLYK